MKPGDTMLPAHLHLTSLDTRTDSQSVPEQNINSPMPQTQAQITTNVSLGHFTQSPAQGPGSISIPRNAGS